MTPQRALIFAIIISTLGCQKQIPQQGMWKGTISIAEDKPLPFQMFLNFQTVTPTGFFLNGTEQTPIPEIQQKGDSLSFILSEYGAALRGVWDGKVWQGKFFRYRADTTWNKFIASPGDSKEIKSLPHSINISLVGKYQAHIYDQNGIDSSTIANFWLKQDSIYGTLIAPDGDYGLLVGTQYGYQVTLTRFTGWQAFVMELNQQGPTWTGNLYARGGKPMKLTLVPIPSTMPELKPVKLTTTKNPTKPFSFSGITSSGQLINSTDDRFKGKTLLLDVMGTWCHNCMDAAPVLQQLYAEFNKDGLEVIGLAFEINDNPELAKKNLSLFQNRYAITYPLLFCGSTKEANIESRLRSQLNNFSGYPTTLFINKNGLVQEIHVGFQGPATGEGYQRQVQQYYEIVKHLLR
jgi:thiol-disulfide isomerase/thioredoxin